LFHIFLYIEILILFSFDCFIYKVLEQNAEEHIEFQPKGKMEKITWKQIL